MQGTRATPKGFSTFQKFLIVFALLGAVGLALKYGAYASTKLNLTLTSQPNLDSGLTAHWTFDANDMPNGLVKDRSNQGNNGSMVNMATSTSYVSGRLGQALSFDGSDDYINTNYQPVFSASDNFSISLWAKVPDTTSDETIFGSTAESGTEDERLAIEIDGDGSTCANDAFDFAVRDTDSAAGDLLCATTDLTDDNWHLLTVTYNVTGNIIVYVDGVAEGTAAVTAFSNGIKDFTGYPMFIGARDNQGSASGKYTGLVDDVRFYNRILSPDEVKQLYQLGGTTKINQTIRSQPSLESGLVGHWTFDGKDMPAGLVKDSSGQGNDGTMRNMSTSTAYIKGDMGQALYFDGANDLVNLAVSSALDLNSNYTLSAWVNPDIITGGTSKATFIKRGSNGSNNDPLAQYWLRMSQTTGALAFVTADGTTAQTDTFGTLTPGKWSFILCTNDGSTKTCYIDGVVSGTPTAVTLGDYVGTENYEGIGCTNTSCGAGQFMGGIDDVRIYNRVLSVDEIQRLYQLGGTTKINTSLNTEPDLSRDLVGYYTFDGKDLPNGLVVDRSGSGNTGSMISMATSTAYIVGKIGQGLNFNGSPEYIRLGSATNLIKNTSAASISVWAKAAPGSSGTRRMVGISDGISNSSRFSFLLTSGNLLTSIVKPGDGDAGGTFSSDNAVTDVTQWHHYVSVANFANNTIKEYIDGVEVPMDASNFTSSVSSNTSPTVANIGTGPATSNFWNGGLDDVRIYNRALSSAEVVELYRMGR